MALVTFISILTGLSAPEAHAAQPNQHTVATYNSQGAKWNDVRAVSNDNDIVAVQEAGPDPSAYGMTLLQTYTTSGYTINEYQWGTRYVYWMSPTGSCRVNQATVTHSRASGLGVAPPGRTGGRPALGVSFGDTMYYNVHAGACGTQNEALELLTNIRNHAATYGHLWAALGDFNRDPDSGVHAWAATNNAYVYHTGQSTQQSGGELDYMVSNLSMANYDAIRRDGRSSDHYPIYFRTRNLAAEDVVSLISDSNHDQYLGFEGGSSANGTRVVAEKNLTKRSQWTMRQAPGGGNSEYIFVNNSTGNCMDLYYGTLSKAGDLVSEYPCKGLPSQTFKIYYWGEEPGTWKIQNKYTQLCVDTMGSGIRYLALWACTKGAVNQHFSPRYI
ncbi:Cytolethal distending toxin subunit B precursor [Streptomyces sp. ADI92-24]|nr:ricin-type beta-trefoil lectin protein [Streptomyces sp. CEV 2-1]RPK35374.1 Cytolethal distending toxin subunit B precursor [Streptomyces sp. ADI92-24]